jgi:hypothetical protein
MLTNLAQFSTTEISTQSSPGMPAIIVRSWQRF